MKKGPRRLKWPMTIEAFAPAKINLTLHVTGQRADGYHLLDSLVVFADIGDRLWCAPGPDMRLTVTGPFADGVPQDARNLVWQAAELAQWTGHIRLEKNLPHGAGIGGGSSDAAALLQALGAADSGLSLGADVPVCRAGSAARMRGVGEEVTPVLGLPSLHAVLVNPGLHVPTPRVFAALDSKHNAPMTDMPTPMTPVAFDRWLRAQRNDLEPPAQAQQPEIVDVLNALRMRDGVGVARMSGSGATCFGLFDSRDLAERGARDIEGAHPDWWVRACALS